MLRWEHAPAIPVHSMCSFLLLSVFSQLPVLYMKNPPGVSGIRGISWVGRQADFPTPGGTSKACYSRLELRTFQVSSSFSSSSRTLPVSPSRYFTWPCRVPVAIPSRVENRAWSKVQLESLGP